jgi:hypothetical protein
LGIVPPSWITLEEIVAMDREDFREILDRLPLAEKPEIRKDLAGIKAARRQGFVFQEPKLESDKALSLLKEINEEREAEGLDEITLDELDTDLLVEEMHICKIRWHLEADKDEKNTYWWIDLGGPCHRVFINADGYIRHFKEKHMAKGRPHRVVTKKNITH